MNHRIAPDFLPEEVDDSFTDAEKNTETPRVLQNKAKTKITKSKEANAVFKSKSKYSNNLKTKKVKTLTVEAKKQPKQQKKKPIIVVEEERKDNRRKTIRKSKPNLNPEFIYSKTKRHKQ